MGYLICKNCGGFYELQPDESPGDFSQCQCGGELVYKENLNNKTNDKNKLPSITSVATTTNEENQSNFKSKLFDVPKALLVSFLTVIVILFKFGVIWMAISYFMHFSNWHSSAAYIFAFFLVFFFSILIRKYIFK